MASTTETPTSEKPIVYGDKEIARITELLTPDHHKVRRKTVKLLKDPLFAPGFDGNLREFRELTLSRLKKIADAQIFKVQDLNSHPLRFFAAQEQCAMVDFSMSVKLSVHFGLFGGSVLTLGTDRHTKLFDDINSVKLPGLFGLTELGHGSNARGIETTAIYDKNTKEFVIHSPTYSSQKYWIGNAALHAKMGTIYANLIIDGDNKGPHAFLVPIRDDSGNIMPGIKITDCGIKMGLNGVDNGSLMFDNVRIPRLNLLDRFGQVAEDGKYITQIENAGVRFNTSIEALVGGRIAVASMAQSISRYSLALAIIYALKRKQFGPPKKDEMILMDYPSHQRRLLIPLARTIALQFGLNYAKHRYTSRQEKDKRDVFLLASGFKAVCTWEKAATLQECREACGGQGFGAANRIGALRTDSDVDLTYEGDNTVLLQAVARALLLEFKNFFSGDKRITGLLGYFKGQVGLFLRSTKHQFASEPLRSFEFLTDAFVWKEIKLLRSLASKLATKVQEKKDGFLAWNECSEHIMKLAKSYVDRICVEKFIEKIQQEKNPNVKKMLELVCALFALSKIEANMGFFLTHKFLSPGRAKEVSEEVDALCAELRPYSKQLANSLGVPKFLLEMAPMIVDPKNHQDSEVLNGYVDFWDENFKYQDLDNDQLASEASTNIQTLPISAKL